MDANENKRLVWPDVPPLDELPAAPRRIILHWTAGTYQAGNLEREHYHYLIEGDGRPIEGVPVAWNMRDVSQGGRYAAHTRALNSYGVGVAFCGMLGATRTDFGQYPLTEEQVRCGCIFVGCLCHLWNLPVNENTVFTHAEAERLHGVPQLGKWDIDVLPWAPTMTPREVGDWLRSQIRRAATLGREI